MSKKVKQLKSYLWPKGIGLLTFWCLSAAILALISSNSKLNTLRSSALNFEPQPKLPKNQTGAISYWRCDPKHNYRPIFCMELKNLCVENNKLGIFKTALHKVVKIQDLKLRFYQYQSAISQEVTPDVKTIQEVVDKLTASKNGSPPKNTWRIDIDSGNVSEVHVNNLNYRLFHDNDLFFAVQSRRAIFTCGHSDIELQGHAKITMVDGSTLESNYIKWSIKNQHFSVNGVYVLKRGGVITTGKGICVDAQLNSVKAQNAKVERKENQKCFAKL